MLAGVINSTTSSLSQDEAADSLPERNGACTTHLLSHIIHTEPQFVL